MAFNMTARVGLVVCAAALTGCQADFGADIHNKTSGPVFAQLMVKANGKNDPAVLGATKRLGPGDRAFVGPVRNSDRPGSVYVVIDSLPNASRAVTLDLLPGTSYLEVFDDGGSLRVMPKP